MMLLSWGMKLFFIALSALAMYIVWELPTPQVTADGDSFFADALAELPDADLLAIAEDAAAAGDFDTAINVLDYIIDEDLPDKPMAWQRKGEYLAEIESRNSAWGRLYRGGWGLATGKVDDTAGLIGAAAGDMIVYGDIRDIVRELAFEDETDELVVLLSSVGLATNFLPALPQLELSVDFLKAARKVKALSKPLVDFLVENLKILKKLPSSIQFLKIKELIRPIYELFINSRSWAHFTAMLRVCADLKQVKFLAYICAAGAENAKVLGQLLTVGFKNGLGQSQEIIKFLEKYGPKGLALLKPVIRKGSRGLEMVLKKPWLAKGLKRTNYAAKFFKNFDKGLSAWWRHFAGKYRFLAEWARCLFLGLGGALIAYIALPGNVFKTIGRRLRPKSSGDGPAGPVAAADGLWGLGYWLLLVFVLTLVFTVISYFTRFSVETALAETLGTFVAAPVAAGPSMSLALTVLFVLAGILGLNYYCYKLAADKLGEAERRNCDSAGKLKLIENLDIFFDLPLYLGLGATILAFIIITLGDLGQARILAYGATLVGIIFAVIMRLTLLKPARERLLLALNSLTPAEEKNNPETPREGEAAKTSDAPEAADLWE